MSGITSSTSTPPRHCSMIIQALMMAWSFFTIGWCRSCFAPSDYQSYPKSRKRIRTKMQCHSPPTGLHVLQVLWGAGPQHIPQVEQFVAPQPAVGGGEVAPLQRNNNNIMRQLLTFHEQSILIIPVMFICIFNILIIAVMFICIFNIQIIAVMFIYIFIKI